MDRVSSDVLHGTLLPFLQLRDLRSLRAVSTRIHTQLSSRPDHLHIFDLKHYVCTYDGCANREFLSNTVDPFIKYVAANTLSRSGELLHNFFFSMCLFPLYSIPFYRIIYLLVLQEFIDTDASAISDAFGSYLDIGNRICSLTNSQPMKCCTCIDPMGKHVTHRAVDCTHIGWCIRTKEGGCVQCLFGATQVKHELSTLPYSFYVYMVMYLLVPGIGFCLLVPLLVLFSVLCVLFGIPCFVLLSMLLF
jgi:hypothetical protein